MSVLIGLIGAVVTLTLFTVTAIFRLGHQAARLEELERWRGSIRQDMHEISDVLEGVRLELQRLGTVIDERWQR